MNEHDRHDKLKELVENEVEEIKEDLKKENKELRKELEKLRTENNLTQKDSQTSSDSKHISRREFIQKVGLGTAGLAALMSPVSALNIKSDSLSFADSNKKYLDLPAGGPFKIQNTNLEVDGSLSIGTSSPSLPLEVGGSKGVRLPVGNNSERSSSPQEGEFRINSEQEQTEVYQSGRWKSIGGLYTPIQATGGDEIYTVFDAQEGVEYRVHAFTSPGTSTFDVADLGSGAGEIDMLIVGGGGGGGSGHGGGGGAGGLIFKENHSIDQTSYDITVGDGGLGEEAKGSHDPTPGENGGDTIAFGMTAIGGGAGGNYDSTNGQDGGSGGGAETWNNNLSPGSALQPGSADGGSGNSGTPGTSSKDESGGGGGAGGTAELPTGDGGIGLDFSSTFGASVGENGWFAGGGAAGFYNNAVKNRGGKGGGGDGGTAVNSDHSSPYIFGQDGMKGTGGGGGGSASYNAKGGDGGSGVVLIRYPLQRP